MRFLLVDRILEWTPNERIVGLKNITMSEDFLEFHFPRYPVMPGIMILESLTQLAGWLEAASSDFENWTLLEHVRHSKFYGFALPGDQVRLEIETVPCDEDGKRVFRCTAKLEDRRCAVAEIETRVVPMLDVESPEEQRFFFKILTRELAYFATERTRRKR